MPEKNISQISLVAEIMNLLEEQFGCDAMNVRELNVVIQAADMIVAEFQKPDVPVKEDMGLTKWLLSDRVGASSKFMARVLSGGGNGLEANYAHPHDPADFGRCLGLLEAVPEYRSRLKMMAIESQVWERLVQNWEELTVLYQEEYPSGKAPKCFQRMKEILGVK